MKTIGLHLIFILLPFISCNKSDGDISPSDYKLDYGATTFFLKNTDYVVSPTVPRKGTYKAFPDDLNIDNSTGNITVSLNGKQGEASQTGLRYRVVYTSPGGKTDTTHIVIAGINFQDRIYSLFQNEETAFPIYNATPGLPVPSGSYTSSNNRLVIDRQTGKLDLKKSVEAGLFRDDPQNSEWRKVRIRYKTNDESMADRNEIELIVYYYTSVSKIPSNISTVMRAHQSQLLGIPPVNIPETFEPEDDEIKGLISASKPRPPCIIIIGN